MSLAKYSREELIFLTKLLERADRFQDMINAIKEIIQLDPVLTIEERNIFSASYKNLITPKRTSWRVLNLMEKKDFKKNPENLPYIKHTKENITKEIIDISQEIHKIIEEILIPNCHKEDSESQVFYLKLMGDYYRYIAEISSEEEFNKNCFRAENSYKLAYQIAEKDLAIYNPIRLGLALNFSVFYYEIFFKQEEGCLIAKMAFEGAVGIIDGVDKNKVKDAIMIIQILKENLIMWTSEMNDEENEN